MKLRDTLSPSEIQNIKLAAQGMLYKEIAETRGIRESTIKTQMMSARKKANVPTTDALIDIAVSEGIVNARCIMLNI